MRIHLIYQGFGEWAPIEGMYRNPGGSVNMTEPPSTRFHPAYTIGENYAFRHATDAVFSVIPNSEIINPKLS